jgi:hypothetical protein
MKNVAGENVKMIFIVLLSILILIVLNEFSYKYNKNVKLIKMKFSKNFYKKKKQKKQILFTLLLFLNS